MFRPIRRSEQVEEALQRVGLVATGPGDFAPEWLAANTHVAIPEETSLHFNTHQCERLAAALRGHGVTQLLAVANEELAPGDLLFELESVTEDLASFSQECGALNFVLLPRSGTDVAVVCCASDDYLLIGGPRRFVRDYAGDLAEAKRRFEIYINAHFESARPALRRAARYFHWLDSAE